MDDIQVTKMLDHPKLLNAMNPKCSLNLGDR